MRSDADVRPASRGALQRAMAFCEDNVARPIQVADIALAPRLSVRTLQSEFRRQLDRTPLQYLRELRLSYAHADLRAIAAGQATGSSHRSPQNGAFRSVATSPPCTPARTADRLPSETLRRRPDSGGIRAGDVS